MAYRNVEETARGEFGFVSRINQPNLSMAKTCPDLSGLAPSRARDDETERAECSFDCGLDVVPGLR